MALSLIQNNLMKREGYSPYCGKMTNCMMPRTKFNGEQFVCPCCGWVSQFTEEFIKEYKEKWHLK